MELTSYIILGAALLVIAVLVMVIIRKDAQVRTAEALRKSDAEANEKAWNTAKNMVNQIGGQWDWSLVPQMACQHSSIIKKSRSFSPC